MRNKIKNLSFPKRFLARLTFINIVVITALVGVSGWSIYNTACVLADGLTTMTNDNQTLFEKTLLQYLLFFSITTIFIGSLAHFYLTKKLINPVQEIILSMKKMKQGEYPSQINVKAKGELAELISQFNDLVQQLKSNEEQRRKLVSDLSHEFRTPLSNLSGYLKALQTGVIDGDQKLYQSLNEETNRLIHLVEQMELLKEWNYVSSQTFMEKSSVQIKTLVEKSIEMFKWTLLETNIKVNVDIEPSMLTVNSEALIQVISNLMDNAINYYEGTGPIIIKGTNLKTEYILTITGPGKRITEHDRQRIFERFYRTDHSRSRDSGGTGLGLAISKEIIEQHKGKIDVSSKNNVHTFWVTLPKD